MFRHLLKASLHSLHRDKQVAPSSLIDRATRAKKTGISRKIRHDPHKFSDGGTLNFRHTSTKQTVKEILGSNRNGKFKTTKVL